MPANVNPVFPITPNSVPVAVGTANSNLDGTGTIATIVTPGTNGTRVDGVYLKASVATTAGMFRIFVKTAGGGTWRLIAEVPVGIVTPSATVAAWSYFWTPDKPLILQSGCLLGGSVENAENINALAIAGDY